MSRSRPFLMARPFRRSRLGHLPSACSDRTMAALALRYIQQYLVVRGTQSAGKARLAFLYPKGTVKGKSWIVELWPNILRAYTVMAYTVMADIVMTYTVMACTVMAYVFMAYIVMA